MPVGGKERRAFLQVGAGLFGVALTACGSPRSLVDKVSPGKYEKDGEPGSLSERMSLTFGSMREFITEWSNNRSRKVYFLFELGSSSGERNEKLAWIKKVDPRADWFHLVDPVKIGDASFVQFKSPIVDVESSDTPWNSPVFPYLDFRTKEMVFVKGGKGIVEGGKFVIIGGNVVAKVDLSTWPPKKIIKDKEYEFMSASRGAFFVDNDGRIAMEEALPAVQQVRYEPKGSLNTNVGDLDVVLEPGVFTKDEENTLRNVVREVYPFVSSYVGEADGRPITISKIPKAAQDAFITEQKKLGGDGMMIAGADWNGKTRTLGVARVDRLTLEAVLPHDFTHHLIDMKMPVPWGEGIATAVSNLYNKYKGRATEFAVYDYEQNNQSEMMPSSNGFMGPLARYHYSLAGAAFTQLLSSDPKFIVNLKKAATSGIGGGDIAEDLLVKTGDQLKKGFKSWYDEQHVLHTDDTHGERLAVLRTGPEELTVLHFYKSGGEERLINGNLTVKISSGGKGGSIYFVKNRGIDVIKGPLRGNEVVEVTDPVRKVAWVKHL